MKQAIFILLLILSPLSLILATPGPDQDTGTLKGRVVDRETNKPLGFVYLHLKEINHTVAAHADGTFKFENVPAGTYTLSASRIGYQTVSQLVTVQGSDTTEVTISLKASVLISEAVEVVGQRSHLGAGLEDASKTISGAELRQNLGTTLAGTLSEIPGFSSRSMGSAPSRPVIRGLGGERVLILQDGRRTGDVSSQSADHAVTVDPVTAEKIEIARGPAALQYGSNAIGGVVNVVRNQISAVQPDHIHGTASLQGKSVNTGAVAAFEAAAPLGKNFALKFDANLRSARNMQTPVGTLTNSGLLSSNSALGVSYIRQWGYAGISAGTYFSRYGIPPDPEGGHEQGVDIEMRKYKLAGKTEVLFDGPFFKSLEADLSYKNYYHREIENSGEIGTEYGLLTTNLSAVVRHEGLFDEGKIGIWAEAKDYAVNGTQTPDSKAHSIAAFLIEEKDFGALHLEAGARFDFISISPEENDPNSSIGNIRPRNFAGLSTSASAIYDFGSGFHAGAIFMHSFRAPSQEELYSEGPHLASYSYEVGNPDLNPERGLGKEVFIRYKKPTVAAEIAVYHNSFPNYIYPRNTGRASIRFPSLNVYQFTGVEARFRGIEASTQLQFLDHWAFSGSLSYTEARRKVTPQEEQFGNDEWQPLPMIPPLKGTIGLTYAPGKLRLGAKARLAAEQNRTAEFETPTDGYAVFDLFAQYRFQSGGLLHTIALNATNIFNTTYRNHLSRIKEIIPEPGRSVSLLYRVYF
ncbi:MAG TPA: TonB-dependent receptor [Balneolaceae bacterium]